MSWFLFLVWEIGIMHGTSLLLTHKIRPKLLRLYRTWQTTSTLSIVFSSTVGICLDMIQGNKGCVWVCECVCNKLMPNISKKTIGYNEFTYCVYGSNSIFANYCLKNAFLWCFLSLTMERTSARTAKKKGVLSTHTVISQLGLKQMCKFLK